MCCKTNVFRIFLGCSSTIYKVQLQGAPFMACLCAWAWEPSGEIWNEQGLLEWHSVLSHATYGYSSVMSNSLQPKGYSLLGTTAHEILQARILEWVAIPFSRGSSWPRDQTQVSCMAGRFFIIWATREALSGTAKGHNESESEKV